MFFIDVQGGTQTMRHLAQDAVVYLMNKEMPRKRVLRLDIEIKNLRKDGCFGMIDSWKDCGKDYSLIELDNGKDTSLYDFIETVCHEFVHLRQFLTGDYRQKGNKIYWKGHDCTDMSYYNQPWEKEAFALQHSLAKYIIKEKLYMTLTKARQTKVRAYK